jgi:outer membrane receptor for ferrienterochelin and colicins
MKFLASFITLFILACFCIEAQQITIKGTVKDKSNQLPLAGAKIVVNTSQTTISTNENGKFETTIPSSSKITLAITYTGYQTINKSLTGSELQQPVAIEMESANSEINEIVVTSTGTPHLLKNTPIQTEVYSSKQIQTTNYAGFMDAITSLSPSFSFQPSAMGEYLSVNGLSNDYVLILIDGKKVSGDVSGNSDMGRLNMNNIDHIEVVKGASSALYGSDAIGAVINIITKKPTYKIAASSTNRLSANMENSTSNSLMLNLGKLKSTTTYDHKATDGYQLSKYEIVTTKTGTDTVETEKMPVNKSADYTLSQKLVYDINQNLSIYAQGSIYNKEIWRPRTAYTYNFLYDDISWSGGSRWQANDKLLLTFDYQSDEYKQTKVYTQASGSFKVGDEDLTKRQHYQNAKLASTYNITDNQTLYAGTEWLNDEMESAYLPKKGSTDKTGNKDITEVGVWLQHDYSIVKNLELVTGARYNNHNAYGSKATFKVALMYKPGNFRVRMNVAQGYKTPTLLELYYDYYVASKGASIIGNSDLKPQQSLYEGLSVEYFTRNITISLTGYNNQLNEMIYLKDVTANLTTEEKAAGIKSRKIYDNMGSAYSRGIDLTYNILLDNGINFGGGVSYCDAKGKANSTAQETPIEKMSEWAEIFHVGYNHQWKYYNLNLNLNNRYEGEKYFTDGNSDPYSIWDFNTSHQFMSQSHYSWTLGAGIRNIFDDTDNRPFGVNYATLDPGRRYYISLKVDLKW